MGGTIMFIDNPNKLKRSLLEIQDEYGLLPSDDLTIIPVIDN
jgi:hypothetical protein